MTDHTRDYYEGPAEAEEEPLDGCPECMTRNNKPYFIWEPPPNSECTTEADYKCYACGFQWTTSWWEGRR